MDDKKNEVVDFDGVSLRIVHYCIDNEVPYESSVPLDQFKDAKGNLDDVKLIKAFNDAKSPLIFTAKAPIPADAVTGSASGLDPHISPANAEVQASRVAKARGVAVDQVKQLVSNLTNGAELGILGEPRVNVLRLNLALDQRFPLRTATVRESVPPSNRAATVREPVPSSKPSRDREGAVPKSTYSATDTERT